MEKLLGFFDFVNESYNINEKENWIEDAIKKPGALHKKLKVPDDKKIPISKISKKIKTLRNKKNRTKAETKTLRELNLAKTLKNINN